MYAFIEITPSPPLPPPRGYPEARTGRRNRLRRIRFRVKRPGYVISFAIRSHDRSTSVGNMAPHVSSLRPVMHGPALHKARETGSTGHLVRRNLASCPLPGFMRHLEIRVSRGATFILYIYIHLPPLNDGRKVITIYTCRGRDRSSFSDRVMGAVS